MNKKGQSLALFIAIIPLIFIVVTFLYQTSIFINQKENARNILEMVMSESITKNLSDDEIKALLKENNITDNIEIIHSDKNLTIKTKIKYPLINKTYEIETNGIIEEVKEEV